MHYLSPTAYAYCLWYGHVVNRGQQNLAGLLYIGSNCSYFSANNSNNSNNNNNNNNNNNIIILIIITIIIIKRMARKVRNVIEEVMKK